MQKKHISIGVIIGIVLIVYWWMQDHPRAPQPVHEGLLSPVSTMVQPA